MKIEISNHAKMRAKERIKEITNWEEAIRFIEKEFKLIQKQYKNWEKISLKKMHWACYWIQNWKHQFIYEKNGSKYKIITYYDNTEKKESSWSWMMKKIRRHMRESNWIFWYNKNINHY